MTEKEKLTIWNRRINSNVGLEKKEEKNIKKHTELLFDWDKFKFTFRVEKNKKKLGFRDFFVLFFYLTRYIILVGIFIVCGTYLTVGAKMQDESITKAKGNKPPSNFNHPFFQLFALFLGMMIFGLSGHWTYSIIRKVCSSNECCKKEDIHPYEPVDGDREPEEKKDLPPINPLFLLLPCFCDFGGTTLLLYGLLLTYASIYQMIRSLVVVFAFVLSIFVLKANVYKFPHKYIGVLLIISGTICVGVSSVVVETNQSAKALSPLVGSLFIVLSQIFYAVGFVVEEKFLNGYDTNQFELPGYEGLFGVFFSLLVLFVFYFIPGSDNGSLESFPAAFLQFVRNPSLMIFVIIFSIVAGVFNVAGKTITKHLSATSRCTCDSLRSVLVWIIQLLRGRQIFSWIQLIGFLVVVVGIFLYNEVGFSVFIPSYCRWIGKIRKKDVEKRKAKLEAKSKKASEKS